MKKGLLLVGILIVVAMLFGNCGGGDDSPAGSTNIAPGQPTLDAPAGAPANGATGVSLTPTLKWNCTDPDGDALTYTVSFGTASTPPVVSTNQTARSYSPASLAYSTTYNWSVKAKDPAGATAASEVWSFTTLAEPTETVTTPAAPSGPATGYTDQTLSYDASGSVSNLGHDLEYRFDWGDGGDPSDWSPTAINNSWAEGTYMIRAQARCVDHPAVVSEWSVTTTVTITVFALETISTPTTPTGVSTAEEGESNVFATSATSSQGHSLRYSYDFGDGPASSWSLYSSMSHAWASVGTYEVKVQARCAEHTTIVSDWSPVKTVTITEAAGEVVTPPDAPTFTDSTVIGFATVFTVTGSISSDGHPVQYQMDFGDGTLTWFAYNATIYHVYDSIGTYVVKAMARCNTHNDITSDWSEEVSVVIVNPPEALAYNTKLVYGDVTNGNIGESYEYNVAHSSATNLGDAMEGQYNWGDGTTSAWVQAAERAQSHTWTAEGTYGITYTGRCTIHNDFTFITDTLWVTMVTEATETVSTPGYVNWTDAEDRPMLDTEIMYYAYGGASSLGHDTEDRISWGDGDTTGWVAASTQIPKTWTVLGTFLMSRQSRCVEHPDIISEWSETSYIITGPESVSTPDAPPGPATGTVNYPVYFLGTGAESSWHGTSWLSYRFAWGDGDTTEWRDRLDTLVGHNYSTVGEYEVTTQAKCVWPGHTNPESQWSLPTTITIVETITGAYIFGPDVGPINKSYTFEVRGAQSDVGHTLEYQIDFGDGTISDWSLSVTADHIYTVAGIFDVLCRARCAEHTEAVSVWSSGHDMTITDAPETVSEPDRPTTYVSGYVYKAGVELTISIVGAASDYGDSLEFEIDYGNGTTSGWVAAEFSSYSGYYISHKYAYPEAGSYDIIARARCATHTEVVSGWSAARDIIVYESVDIPSVPTGPATGIVGETLTFTTTHSGTCSAGHPLEYRFNYQQNYSTIFLSEWSTSLSDSHTFTGASNYYRVNVQARCSVNTFVTSTYTEFHVFTITE